jgi:hypothetical protein
MIINVYMLPTQEYMVHRTYVLSRPGFRVILVVNVVSVFYAWITFLCKNVNRRHLSDEHRPLCSRRVVLKISCSLFRGDACSKDIYGLRRFRTPGRTWIWGRSSAASATSRSGTFRTRSGTSCRTKVFFLSPDLPRLGYFKGEIVSRTEVAFYFYGRSRVPIKITLSALLSHKGWLEKFLYFLNFFISNVFKKFTWICA